MKQTFSFFHFSSLNTQTKAKPKIIRSLFWAIFILLSTLSLSAQIRLEGRLTTPKGAPIAGALVAAIPEGFNPPLSRIPVDRTIGAAGGNQCTHLISSALVLDNLLRLQHHLRQS